MRESLSRARLRKVQKFNLYPLVYDPEMDNWAEGTPIEVEADSEDQAATLAIDAYREIFNLSGHGYQIVVGDKRYPFFNGDDGKYPYSKEAAACRTYLERFGEDLIAVFYGSTPYNPNDKLDWRTHYSERNDCWIASIGAWNPLHAYTIRSAEGFEERKSAQQYARQIVKTLRTECRQSTTKSG